MSDDEMRVKIAGLVGPWVFEPEHDYVVIKEAGETRMRYYPARPFEIGECLDLAGVPDYLSDLNAMAEARAAAIKTDQQWIDYWIALYAQVKAVGHDSYTLHESYKRILSATARDHAIAFIATVYP